jgi:hypothetical protein
MTQNGSTDLRAASLNVMKCDENHDSALDYGMKNTAFLFLEFSNTYDYILPKLVQNDSDC